MFCNGVTCMGILKDLINTNDYKAIETFNYILEKEECEKELERAYKYFINILVHDIKIPTLAQLRGLELLRNKTLGTINDSQEQLIHEIEASCNYALEIINIVTNTYKIESETQVLDCQNFSIKKLIEEVIENFSSISNEKQIQIISNIKKDTIICADREELKTVVTLLLSNAIWYSKSKSKIYFKENLSNKFLEILIKTHGIPLSKDECLTLFQKPINSHSGIIGQRAGLYLCKKILELHDGNLFVQTDTKDTNTFSLILPLNKKQAKLVSL